MDPNPDIREWAKKVEAAKPEMDVMVRRLDEFSGVRVDLGNPRLVGALPYVITVFVEDATLTMHTSLMDWQTG